MAREKSPAGAEKKYNLIFQSDNEKLNSLYDAYLKAKDELSEFIYYEGITLTTSNGEASQDNQE
ncbi:MAG: hypothetical protein FWC60_09785 [Firmicutes bacterium]|nr:hypothetical protein [Bacillota bacterium]